MAVTLLVTGEIQYGKLHTFLSSIADYKMYRKKMSWVVPEVFVGMSGPMNSVAMLYRYKSANDLEKEEKESSRDQQYGRLAGKLRFREPTITYNLYREV